MLVSAATSFAGEDVANGSAIAAGLILDAVYFTVFESSALQGTPGKRLLGMVVVDLGGNRLTFGRASARYAAKTISVLILFAGCLQIGLHSRKQGLHDVLARTLVIRRPMRASQSAAQPA